jgi:hypothetical protein
LDLAWRRYPNRALPGALAPANEAPAVISSPCSMPTSSAIKCGFAEASK